MLTSSTSRFLNLKSFQSNFMLKFEVNSCVTLRWPTSKVLIGILEISMESPSPQSIHYAKRIWQLYVTAFHLQISHSGRRNMTVCLYGICFSESVLSTLANKKNERINKTHSWNITHYTKAAAVPGTEKRLVCASKYLKMRGCERRVRVLTIKCFCQCSRQLKAGWSDRCWACANHVLCSAQCCCVNKHTGLCMHSVLTL